MRKRINPLLDVHKQYKTMRLINPYLSSVIPRDSLIYEYLCDNNLSDSSGNNYLISSQIIVPPITYVPNRKGFINSALLVIGGDNHKISLAASVKGLSSVTHTIWIKTPTSVASQQCIFIEDTGTSGYTRFGLFINTSLQLLLVGRDTNTGAAFAITSAALSPNTWYCVFSEYNAATDIMQLTINNATVYVNNASKGAFTSTSPLDIRLASFAYVNQVFLGAVDDIRMYARVLTAEEKTAIFNE
jgi:hypothetical protein